MKPQINKETQNLNSYEGYHQLEIGNFLMIGKGIAGVETVYCFPRWGLTIDTGRAPEFCVHQPYLALTHLHPDHAASLPYYLGLRGLYDLEPLRLILPKSKAEMVEEFLDQYKKLADLTRLAYTIENFEKPINLRPKVFLDKIPAFHCTETQGYLIREERKKINPKFKGLSQTEIIAAKKKGIQIDETKLVDVFAFSGDTRPEFFDTKASKAQIFMMECSFFKPYSNFEKIHFYGHTHLRDWVKNAEKIESEIVIMTHTTRRHSKQQIEKFCRTQLPKDLFDRLVILR